MKHRLFSSLIFGALALSFASCGPHFERKVSGLVLAVDGPAVANKSTKLSAGSFVQPGDVITTAAVKHAIFTYPQTQLIPAI